MGWRDTQAKIESGALNYNRPARSNSDYFFEAATSSFSDAFRSKQAEKAEDKRYARNRADKLKDEERTDARALARENETARKRRLEAALAEAKQEEKVIRERRTKAKKLLQQNGRDDTNPNFMQFAMDHLQAYGDSYSDAEEKFTELNKRITEVGPMQGPLLRRSDVDLDVSMESTRNAYKDAKDIGDTETQDKIRDTADDLNALGGTMQGGMDKQMDAILGPKGDPATVSGVREALRSGESGGDTEAVDFNKEDGKDHVGLYQFGQARLDDYNNANNTSHTVADLKAMSEEEQEAIADWHFADIETFIDDNGLDKFVGQTVGGVNITRSGLIAMAHLGGNGGMKKFLETDGEYNPDDSSSTVKGNSLAQYAEKFGTSEATTTRSGGLGEGELPEESPYPKFEIDAKSSSFDMTKYLDGLTSPNTVIGRMTEVKKDPLLTPEQKVLVAAELQTTLDTMNANAKARASANKVLTPEQQALETYKSTDQYKNLTPIEQAAFDQNFGLITKQEYSGISEAIAAYSHAEKIGDAANMGRIESIISDMNGGNEASRVFVVDANGFGQVKFVDTKFDTESKSITKTIDGQPIDPNTQILGDVKSIGEKIMKDRRSMESGLKQYNNDVAQFFTLSTTMQDIVQLAEDNPGVLTKTAGLMSDISSVMSEAGTVIGVLQGMQADSSGNIEKAAYENELRKKGLLEGGQTLEDLAADFNTLLFSDKNMDLIKARKALQAKLALAPFRLGAAEGQSSTALSNQDREFFMRFFSVFKESGGLKENFSQFLVQEMDELNTKQLRYSPNGSEMKTFKDANGFYPTSGFAMTVEEFAEAHPNADKFTQIIQGLQEGDLVTTNSAPEVTEPKPAEKPPENEVSEEDLRKAGVILGMDQDQFNSFVSGAAKGGKFNFKGYVPAERAAIKKRLLEMVKQRSGD